MAACQPLSVHSMRSILLSVLLAATPCSGFVAMAQRWPSNASGLWRPEQIALRGGALSAIWELPNGCAQ